LKRALIILAMIVALLLGGAYEHAFLTRNRLQLAADSAAEGAALAAVHGRDIRQAVRDRLAVYRRLGPGVAVEIEWPPNRGRFRGWRDAARVTLHGRWKLPLLPDRLALPMDAAATVLAGPLPGSTQPSLIRVE
jgi:hypothetical protein